MAFYNAEYLPLMFCLNHMHIKYSLTSLLLVIASFWLAAQEPEPLPPLDAKYMGEHEFVIVSKGTTLFVSHLPKYKSPKNVQIIYGLDTKNPELRLLTRDADLVTARTGKFNLQRLMRGEEVDTTMKVYMGHLQQGGMPIYEEVNVTFDEKLYVREMNELKPSSIRRIYDKVEINKSDVIMVHQIQSAPSYDHLVMVYDIKGCMNEFNTSSAIPDPNQIFMRFTHCGGLKPLYYNTQGFEQ